MEEDFDKAHITPSDYAIQVTHIPKNVTEK